MTLAAIDRLVHYATILEMNVESYRRRAALDRIRGASRPPARATTNENTSSPRNNGAPPRDYATAPPRRHAPIAPGLIVVTIRPGANPYLKRRQAAADKTVAKPNKRHNHTALPAAASSPIAAAFLIQIVALQMILIPPKYAVSQVVGFIKGKGCDPSCTDARREVTAQVHKHHR
jgi:hypothetical protein